MKRLLTAEDVAMVLKLRSEGIEWGFISRNVYGIGVVELRDLMCTLGTPRFWLNTEERYLMENYPVYGARSVADHLGRTVNSIKKKAFKLGVRGRARDQDYIKNELPALLLRLAA